MEFDGHSGHNVNDPDFADDLALLSYTQQQTEEETRKKPTNCGTKAAPASMLDTFLAGKL